MCVCVCICVSDYIWKGRKAMIEGMYNESNGLFEPRRAAHEALARDLNLNQHLMHFEMILPGTGTIFPAHLVHAITKELEQRPDIIDYIGMRCISEAQ